MGQKGSGGTFIQPVRSADSTTAISEMTDVTAILPSYLYVASEGGCLTWEDIHPERECFLDSLAILLHSPHPAIKGKL